MNESEVKTVPGALRRLQRLMVAATLLAVLALTLFPRAVPPNPTQYTSIFLEPVLLDRGSAEISEARAELLALAAFDSAWRGLQSRRQLLPLVDPETRGFVTKRAPENQSNADECLEIAIRCRAQTCTLGLARLRQKDQRRVWERQGIELKTDDLRAIDSVIAHELDLIFARHERAQEAAELFALPEDYERFLKLIGHKGDVAPDAAINTLEKIRASSPRFFEALIREAALRIERNDPLRGDPLEVERILGQARRIAGADPRALVLAIPLTIEAGRLDDAAELLAQLERIAPFEPSLPKWQRLLDRPGRQEA